MPPRLQVVAYEDRPTCLVGVKLLALSLQKHMPDSAISVSTAPELIAPLRRWADDQDVRSLTVCSGESLGSVGWNVKPAKLLEALECDGEAVWIDSDVLVTGDFGKVLRDLNSDVIVVGQEFRGVQKLGGRLRANCWGLACERYLPYTTNSGFIRVTRKHVPLLRRWRELMETQEYIAAQAMPIPQRPIGMVSDQDVLWALLSSSEFGGVPVRYLKCGKEIIQNCGANGFGVAERIRVCLKGMPELVHALGKRKPWGTIDVPSAWREPREYVMLATSELSPYLTLAVAYEDQLGEQSSWLHKRTLLAKTLHSFALGNPAIEGLPLALVAQCLSLFGRKAKL